MPEVSPGELVLVTGYLVAAVAIFLGIVVGLFVGIRGLARTLFGPRRRLESELGLEVLEGRRLRGEISEAECSEGRRILGV